MLGGHPTDAQGQKAADAPRRREHLADVFLAQHAIYCRVVHSGMPSALAQHTLHLFRRAQRRHDARWVHTIVQIRVVPVRVHGTLRMPPEHQRAELARRPRQNAEAVFCLSHGKQVSHGQARGRVASRLCIVQLLHLVCEEDDGLPCARHHPKQPLHRLRASSSEDPLGRGSLPKQLQRALKRTRLVVDEHQHEGR